MGKLIFLSIIGISVIIVSLVIFIKSRKGMKLSSISKMCLESFLGNLAKNFEKEKLKHITEYTGPQRTTDEIAAIIAKELSKSLATQLQALLSNLQYFKKNQERVFSADEITNHFIDKMIPNLASLYTQYSTKTWKASLDNCEDFLYRVSKIKITEVLKNT